MSSINQSGVSMNRINQSEAVIPVHDDAVRLISPGALVEHHEVLSHLKIMIMIMMNIMRCSLTMALRSWMMSCRCCCTRTVAAYLETGINFKLIQIIIFEDLIICFILDYH